MRSTPAYRNLQSKSTYVSGDHRSCFGSNESRESPNCLSLESTRDTVILLVAQDAELSWNNFETPTAELCFPPTRTNLLDGVEIQDTSSN